MATYNLPNSPTFEAQVDSTDDLATLGTDAASGIELGNGTDSIYIGAGGQTAVAGLGGSAGADTFVIGTDGQADMAVVADSAADQAYDTEIVGGSGLNTLKIVGGATTEAPVELSNFYELKNITNISVDSASTVLVANDKQNYNITAGDGSDTFDLTHSGSGTTLTAGNGDDTVWVGATGQAINLGSGTNTVIVPGQEFVSTTFEGGSNHRFDLSHAVINGGSGDANTLIIADSFSSPPVLNSDVSAGSPNPDSVMGPGVVGFATVQFATVSDGVYDINDTSNAHLVTNTTDMNTGQKGLTVDGTTYGGHVIVLEQTNQSYIGNTGNGGEAAAANVVILDGTLNNLGFGDGGIASGVTLDGGVDSSGSTLVLDQTGTYIFGTQVKDFEYVNVEGGSTNLKLNALSNDASANGGYDVTVNGGDGGAVLDHLVGGAGNNVFNIVGGYDTPLVFEAGSLINGGANTATGPGLLGETLQIGTYATGDFIDLSQATLSNLDYVNIYGGNALTLTSDQIIALDADAVARGQNPDTVFTEVNASCEPATLFVDVGATTTDLNVANLHLAKFEGPAATGEVVILDNNLGDTIYAGPGNETIVLGAGNDWVNAGSGNDTLVAGADSGSQSVLIGGNDGANDTFLFGTAESTFVTSDTVVAPTSGIGIVEVTSAATVDFTNATFLGFGASETVQIDSEATAIFTLPQLAALTAEGVHFTSDPGTLEILATSSGTNQVTVADLGGFTDQVVVDATSFSDNTSAPVIIDVSALSNPTTVEAESNSAFWSGYYEIKGGADTTVVFDNPGGTSLSPFDLAIGNGGNYTLHVVTDTDFSTGTASLITGAADSVTIAIDQGATATFDATQISGENAGAVLFNDTVDPTANAHLVIQDGLATFTQESITIDQNSWVGGANNPYNLDETINVQFSGSGPVVVDLTDGATNSGQTEFNDDLTVTLAVGSGDATGGVTVWAGIGPESLTGGVGNDSFVFSIADSSTGAVAIDDTLNGGLGTNTIDVGAASGAGVYDDFTGSTISAIQIENINAGDTGVFWSTQVDATVANVSGTFVIDVNETDGVFSLINNPISNVGVLANLTLNLYSGSVTLYDDMQETNTIYAGTGPETIYDGAFAESIYAGPGTDTIYVRDGGAGIASLYGSEASGSSVTFDFLYNGDTSATPTHTWKVAEASTTFFVDAGTIQGGHTAANGAVADLYIDSNTDLTHATIGGLSAITVDATVSGSAVAFTDTQLLAFGLGSATQLINEDSSANLVIAHGAGDFSSVTETAETLDLKNPGWTGSVTLDAPVAGEHIDASGLGGAGTAYTGWNGGTGVYIYGAAGDTITGSGNNGDYILGGGVGTHIIISSDNDTLRGGGGNGNIIEFTAAATDGNNDVIRGGGGSNEVMQIDGHTVFDNTGVFATIKSVTEVNFDNATPSSSYSTEWSYSQVLHDQLSIATPLKITDHGGTNDTVTFQVDGTGNVDLSKLDTSGFTANIGSGGSATVYVDETNTTSVTVVGSNNGVNTSTGTQAGDNIHVAGLGDTVVFGTGANQATFGLDNNANDVRFNFSALNNGSATNAQSLGAMGNLVTGLHNSESGVVTNNGYVDIAGYNLASNAVNATPVSGAALDGANGFSKYGVIEDSFTVTPGSAFLASGKISGSGVQTAAINIEGHFTDASHAVEKGFITAADGAGDVALFYVNTTGQGTNGAVLPTDIHLVGVMENAITAGHADITASFFHLH